MRKRVKIILTLIAFCMILSVFIFSKFMPPGQDFKKLTPPETGSFKYKGTWRITEKYNYKEGRTLELKEEYAYLDTNRIFINNNIYDNIRYKLRVVDLKDYFSKEYNIDYKRFYDEDKEVDLISPLNNNTLIGEIVKLEDNKLLILVNDVIYTVINVSDDVSNFPNNDDSKLYEQKSNYSDVLKECAYIGLKRNRTMDENGIQQEQYRTLFIGVDNGKVEPVYERDNIFYPRLKGFWELVPKRITKNGKIKEYFDTYNIADRGEANGNITDIDSSNRYLDLKFISNNYISVEEFDDKYSEKYSRYKIIPVDNIYSKSGVSIDIISGAEGYEALKNSSEIALDNLDSKDSQLKSDAKLDSTNIGVIRKNGRWVLEGRTKVTDDASEDLKFDINMINTKKLIIYDNLYVRWNIIKTQNPLIKDVYTSPNGKVAIVVLDDYILVYEIENSQLKGEPIKRIKKDRDESVVMAEWTSSFMVDSWEKVFKQEAKEVEN